MYSFVTIKWHHVPARRRSHYIRLDAPVAPGTYEGATYQCAERAHRMCPFHKINRINFEAGQAANRLPGSVPQHAAWTGYVHRLRSPKGAGWSLSSSAGDVATGEIVPVGVRIVSQDMR